jgi:MFS family permease
MLSYFAYSYYQYLFFYWINYYFEKVLKVENEQARRAAFLIALAQGAGMAIGGMSNDVVCRILGVANGRRAIMLTGMSLCAVLTWTAINQRDPNTVVEGAAVAATSQADFDRVVLLIALALGCEGMCEALYWTAATEIGGKYRGFACAFLNTGGNIGGFISPVLTPMIAEHPRIGWNGAIGIACVIVVFGGILWLWIKPCADSRQPAFT